MKKRFDPSCSDRTLLYAAARLIEIDARAMKECHSMRGRFVVIDEIDKTVKAEYDAHMHLVRELRARARMADTDRVP